LRETDFTDADLRDIQFGEYPRLECKDDVYCIAYSPDGQWLAAVGRGKDIALWHIHGDSWEEAPALKGHTEDVNSVAFDPSGQMLASGSSDNTVRLWSVAEKKEITTLKGHTSSVVTFDPSGQMLASAGDIYDSTVRLWSGRKVRKLLS